MKKPWRPVLVLLSGLLSWSILLLLASNALDPVVTRPDTLARPEYAPHGVRSLSGLGAALWTVVLAVNATVVAVVSSRRTRGYRLLLAGLVTFVASCIYVLMTHPYLLFAVLPAHAETIAELADSVPLLGDIYNRWAFPRLRWWLGFGFAFLGMLCFYLISLTGRQGSRR